MRVPRKRLSELIRFVAAREKPAIREVDLAVVDSRQMASLNRRYLHRRGPTDVLSFDLTGPADEGISAQLIVCGDLAVKEGLARGHGRQRELMLYVVHGLLHLMGYDDRTAVAARQMRDRQENILSAFLHRRRGR